MTIDEKRKRLSEHCHNRRCTGCVLSGKTTCSCGVSSNFETMSIAEVIGAYELVYGNELSKTVKTEDDETIITIKSRKPLDSVDVYFKED